MSLTKYTLGLTRALVVGAGVLVSMFSALGCATSSGGEERVTVVRPEEKAAETGGIPPDKQAEIQLLLQQRNPSTLKCYNDVLAEKHDRAFKGRVTVLVTLEPSGKASNVTIVKSTLNNQEVHDCLVNKLKEFEFPALEHSGSMQYDYMFEPAY